MASGLVNYCGGTGGLQTFLGVQSQAPHGGTCDAHGKNPLAKKETPREERAIASGKGSHFCRAVY